MSLKRSPMPPRKAYMARTPMKRHARPAAETTRIYGTPQHRAWMKSQPCFRCGKTPSDAAHIRNGGLSRKADWDATIPLCSDTIEGPGCHTHFDTHKAMWRAKYDLEDAAATYAVFWRIHEAWSA